MVLVLGSIRISVMCLLLLDFPIGELYVIGQGENSPILGTTWEVRKIFSMVEQQKTNKQKKKPNDNSNPTNICASIACCSHWKKSIHFLSQWQHRMGRKYRQNESSQSNKNLSNVATLPHSMQKREKTFGLKLHFKVYIFPSMLCLVKCFPMIKLNTCKDLIIALCYSAHVWVI